LKTIKEVFAENLRRLRGDRTQAALSEAADIPLRTLQKWEAGRLPRDEGQLQALATALGVAETALFIDASASAEPTPQEALEVLSRALALAPTGGALRGTAREVMNIAATLTEAEALIVLPFLQTQVNTLRSPLPTEDRELRLPDVHKNSG
jgi:transcriptional regulator with XRE-family HTH domain